MALFVEGNATEGIFEFGGGREMVETDRLNELLQTLTQIRNPSVIRLSNKSFSHPAAEALGEILVNFKNVKVADISDIIAGRPETEALKTLTTLCNSLSGNTLLEVSFKLYLVKSYILPPSLSLS